MSQISLALPRPILKHPSQPPPDLSIDKPLSAPITRQCRNTVHFPPSPTLTRTFSAHSSLAYDRSPIVVLPNICALPARGCPGRTYIPGCTKSSPLGPSSHLHASKAAVKTGGKHMYPRRAALGFALVAEATPAGLAASSSVPPSLVPDVSSESDESDGFASHPSECDSNAPIPNPLTFLPFASLPNLNIGEGLLHSPESPDEGDYQYHKYEEEKRRRRKRDRDRDHGKGGREQCPRQRAQGRDVTARDFERKLFNGGDLNDDEDADDDDIAECRYKSFYSSTSLRGCGLDDDTCLGGF